MSERLRELERERDQLRRDWGGLANHEVSQLDIEIQSERSQNRDEQHRSVFGCGNSFHGRKYS
jgi:hypothetical protein